MHGALFWVLCRRTCLRLLALDRRWSGGIMCLLQQLVCQSVIIWVQQVQA